MVVKLEVFCPRVENAVLKRAKRVKSGQNRHVPAVLNTFSTGPAFFGRKLLGTSVGCCFPWRKGCRSNLVPTVCKSNTYV